MPQAETTPETPVDIAKIRDQIRQAIGRRALGMVETTMDEVEDGHYLAMKYLFEIVGLFPASAAAESPEDNSLAQILLKKLGLDPELTRPQTKVSKDSLESWPSASGDAVE